MAGLQGRAVDDFLPRALHVIQCTEVRMLDLRGMDAQTAVGLDPADLVSDDRGACQAVGEAAHFLDFDGVLAPSAAAPTTGVVVALFIDKTDPSAVTVVATTDFNPSPN
jgi:RES domain-containing protein